MDMCASKGDRTDGRVTTGNFATVAELIAAIKDLGAEGSMTQREIARELGVSPTTVQRVLVTEKAPAEIKPMNTEEKHDRRLMALYTESWIKPDLTHLIEDEEAE